jgi:apolipoprotein N-acyltransferase
MIAWGIIVACVAAVPVFGSNSVGTMRVLVAQGNSNAGLFAQHEPGDILSEHVSATLMAQKDPRAEGIDAIVWPENASDIDPLRSPLAASSLTEVSRLFDAPIVTGTITNPRGEEYFNSSLVWMHGSGAIAQYDKMRPVPFAEYMPNREFFRALVPDLVDLVGRDYSFGTRPNVVRVSGVPVGLSICFDITDNSLTRQMVDNGAQVIFAQTNNADFGTTDENLQQLAIARLAAMETGRTVVNDSTVGKTAVITSNGSTQAKLEPYQPGYLIADVNLSTTVTPAVVVGRTLELLLCLVAILGVATLGWLRRTRRSQRGSLSTAAP